jgi:pSer/pThr/pTyr-binding forkhead associated (FHA) protein
MVAMRAQLIPLDGTQPIDLVKDLTLVGRKAECDLCLPHKSVSKMHCVIVKTDGVLLIRDLGSTNGSRVNGQRVRRAALLPNDQLSIAAYKFQVSFGPEEASLQPQDHTQHLDAKEVASLLHKAEGPGQGQPPGNLLSAPLRPNALPDVYPNDEAKSV